MSVQDKCACKINARDRVRIFRGVQLQPGWRAVKTYQMYVSFCLFNLFHNLFDNVFLYYYPLVLPGTNWYTKIFVSTLVRPVLGQAVEMYFFPLFVYYVLRI